jgi:hypothetical protein
MNRFHLRFPRTAADAFKDAQYGIAVEHYTRAPLWRRILRALVRWC